MDAQSEPYSAEGVKEEVTRVLNSLETADHAHAAADLLPLLYTELRHMAAAKMAQEPPGQTLQPTALVHAAWLRLAL